MSVTIPAGRINRLFGTDGGVMLSLYADFPAQFDTGTPLLVTIDALEVPLYCERFERRGTSGAVASFADFDTERRAQELVGLEFRIECDEDEDDEFYLEDLIGFAVTCTEAGADGAMSRWWSALRTPSSGMPRFCGMRAVPCTCGAWAASLPTSPRQSCASSRWAV